jgi:ribosome biogenesis protein ENP2
MAGDATKILQFFLPSIGPAPKWCSYLENITEELEEDNALLGESLTYIFF